MNTLTGARWWKFDFHTHTPHSTDTHWYRMTGQSGELTPSDWLKKYMEAQVDCVAITDHNGGAWVDRLRSEYEALVQNPPNWFRTLTLFPGVELSVNHGIHILAIFGPDATTSTIDGLLGAVGYTGTKGDPLVRTNKSCLEVAQTIVSHGGLCIPAHVDIANGMLKVTGDGRLDGDSQTVRQMLESGLISAIEVRDVNWTPPGLYSDTKVNLPWLLATDCDNFQGSRPPGSHFTWIKMGTPSLEGLRLALLDGKPLSVLRSDEYTTDPNLHADIAIESLSVSTLRHMGRPSPVVAEFSPWLTCIIGGRGSGKSTVIECLRLALHREQELPSDLEHTFQDFCRIPAGRRERGALQEDSGIELIVRKDTGRYRVSWSQSNRTRLLATENNGAWVPAEGDISARFPVRIFSQKEIFSLAGDSHALMRIIDDAEPISKIEWKQTWDAHVAKFKRIRSEQRELLTRLSARERLKGELEDIIKRLAIFEEGGNREVLQNYQLTRRQLSILDAKARDLSDLEIELRNTAVKLDPPTLPLTELNPEVEHEKAALELVSSAKSKQDEVIAELKRIADDVQSFVGVWEDQRQTSLWQKHFEQVTAAYETLIEQFRLAGVTDPSSYSSLVERRQEIERELKSITATEERIEQLKLQAAQCLKALFLHRCELTKRRSEFVERVLQDNRHVRVRINAFGESGSDCDREYRQALGCDESKFRRDILSEDGGSGILSRFYRNLPNDATARQIELGERIKTLKQDTLQMAVTGRATEKCTQWFAKFLNGLDAHILDVIETWWPEDSLIVDYRRSGSGDRWLPIEQGSPGQQTAAMLAFILSYGNQPIVLDQPEDDLDNHLIYDLIVQQIRETKRTRQIIIATHNPNIVVNGDAEKVLAMGVNHSQCVVLEQGSGCLQESQVREQICRVMEGGKQAFQQRYRRIISEENNS